MRKRGTTKKGREIKKLHFLDAEYPCERFRREQVLAAAREYQKERNRVFFGTFCEHLRFDRFLDEHSFIYLFIFNKSFIQLFISKWARNLRQFRVPLCVGIDIVLYNLARNPRKSVFQQFFAQGIIDLIEDGLAIQYCEGFDCFIPQARLQREMGETKSTYNKYNHMLMI